MPYLFPEEKYQLPETEFQPEPEVIEPLKDTKPRFNTFALANAFGMKNKAGLWTGFRQAVGAGVALEEITGILFWKAKDMLLKKNFGKFEEAELKNFSAKLSYLLPQARQEGRDAEIALEEFLLKAF